MARAAGVSAWQFIAPAARDRDADRRRHDDALQSDLGDVARAIDAVSRPSCSATTPRSAPPAADIWLRQRGDDGQTVINAKSSRQQGIQLGGVSIFRFDEAGHFRDRIEAKSATLEAGYWRLEEARFFASGVQPADRDYLSAQDQPDAGPGRRKLCHTRDRPVLAASLVYRACRERRRGRRRLSAAVLSVAWRCRSTWPPWCCWPPRSACGSSAWAACRRWCSAASAQGFCSTSWRKSPAI